MTVNRRRCAIVAIALIAAILAACSGTSSTAKGTASNGPTGSGNSALSGLYGKLPPIGGTAHPGGVLTIGVLEGASANYILPILPSANGIVSNPNQFLDILFSPLYFEPGSASPVIDTNLSLALPPTYSNGDRTVTIKLKPGLKWSNGAPVDANDVIFDIDLVKAAVKESAANYYRYTPGFFPDNIVSATASGQYTVVLKLSRAFNPSFFYQDELTSITPLPSTSWNRDAPNGPALDYSNPANAKLIYDYLAKQAQDLATYASNPLWQDVDGQMKLTSYSPNNGAYTMVPNTSYSGPDKAQISEMKAEPFTSPQAQFNALAVGSLDIGEVDITDVAEIPRIQSQYYVFGEPSFGPNSIVFNFKDKADNVGKIFSQLYIRQAMAHLVDQPGYVSGLYKNAGAAAYGPVPVVPKNPYTPSNSLKAQYPYSIPQASKLLSSHGWKVVKNGTTTCTSPGTGSGHCGAGIPAGASMDFTLYYKNDLSILTSQMAAFAQAAKEVGINITPIIKPPAFINSNFNDAAFPTNDSKWAMRFGGFTQEPYPTTFGIYNSTGSLNEGGYSDTQADALINSSVYGSNPNAVEQEASYLATNLPAIFQPSNDLIWAVKRGVGAHTANAFSALTQYQFLPWDWYFTG